VESDNDLKKRHDSESSGEKGKGKAFSFGAHSAPPRVLVP
jgi:hypothetical protein